MEQYRRNWMEDIDRLCSDSIPKMILIYQPVAKEVWEDLRSQ
jgi:hypothetical protein